MSALQAALSVSTPEIFNSDQGSQYTSEAFTKALRDAEVRISMDWPWARFRQHHD